MLTNTQGCEKIITQLKNLDEVLSQTLTDYSLAINSCHQQDNNQVKQQLEQASDSMGQLSQQIAQLATLIKNTEHF